MQVLALVLSFGLSFGPSFEPGAAAADTAVQWRVGPEARAPSATTRERLREILAGRDGLPISAVRDRAVERARFAVAHELPASVRARHRALREALDEADAAYRGGRFEDALATLEAITTQLQAEPDLPGAAASAREADLLRAKLAWARGERDRAELALLDALRVDPRARLSLREASPELVEIHARLQAESLAGRDAGWIEPQIAWPGMDASRLDAEVIVEIDGVDGLRPVPPGPHFIVVRRPGYEPFFSWREAGDPWQLPERAERIPDDPDASVAQVCEVLGLELLVLAERRGPRIGLQAWRCEGGYGAPWFGPPEQLEDGVAQILAGPFAARELALAGAWPSALIETDPGPGPGPEPEPVRPWYRRGWIWGTSAGVALAVTGSVVLGVVLGGRERALPRVEVDAGKFIGGL